ncbi:MAG: D-alanyl-D-alanine dipeptidase [Bacteroidetes bacterium]|nr:D-alanyl-D-alanine dipeptidase [Bacteroidota bacterium]
MVHQLQIKAIYGIVFLLTPIAVLSQDTVLNKYGLWVIHDVKTLQQTILKDAAKQMVDIKKQIPAMVLDLRYSTTNNFMHQKLYPQLHTTFLRKPAADALLKVMQALQPLGLSIKIFDAYRPYSITEKMWEPVKDDRYAADPKKGSGHNRGIAVDLTLIDTKTGKELAMGTGFDNFSDTAHHAFTHLPEAVLKNRLLLKNTMEQFGFKALDTEWWHYSLPDAAKYELLDVEFGKLKGMGN